MHRKERVEVIDNVNLSDKLKKECPDSMLFWSGIMIENVKEINVMSNRQNTKHEITIKKDGKAVKAEIDLHDAATLKFLIGKLITLNGGKI